MALHLIMTAVIATAAPGCSWAHPGANPYRGDPVAAIADFDMPDDTRRKLRAMMAAHATTDVALITRDTIAGHAGYTDLREMHSGHGQVCHGAVDRSAWSTTRRERALVYCADDVCVLVPTICNNVSLVTRKPEHEPAGPPLAMDEPIDISPSAGPPSPAPGPTDTPQSDNSPFLLPPTEAGVETSSGGPPEGGGGGTTNPGGAIPPTGPTGPAAPTGPIEPIGGEGGGPPCCVAVPPTGTPSPPTAVPEAPTAWMLAAGLAWLVAGRRRARRAASERDRASP